MAERVDLALVNILRHLDEPLVIYGINMHPVTDAELRAMVVELQKLRGRYGKDDEVWCGARRDQAGSAYCVEMAGHERDGVGHMWNQPYQDALARWEADQAAGQPDPVAGREPAGSLGGYAATQEWTAYERVMDLLVELASQVAGLPLDKLARTISAAEALGPILHPTEYRNADLASQRTLVEAAVAFRRAVWPVLGWPNEPGPP